MAHYVRARQPNASAPSELRGLCASVLPPMARKSLRPHLNQIRTWTRQGRTDAWVAHQLEVTVQQIVELQARVGPARRGARRRRRRLRLRRRVRSARRRRRADRRGARGGRAGAPGGRGGRGGRARAARRAGRRAEEDDEEEAPKRRARRGGAHAQAARRRPARGHLRPRRGGLRPVARPGRRRRPRSTRSTGPATGPSR